MPIRLSAFVLFTALGAVCLLTAQGGAQGQYPQNRQYQPQPQYQYQEPDYRQEEYERRMERREREQERAIHHEEEWQRHQQRYFGGIVLEPYPGESPKSYRHRVNAQCNMTWQNCATYCNTIQNPNRRAACVANCNNELYECRAQR